MCILVNSLTNDKNRKIVVAVSNEITLCFQVLKDFLDTAHEEVKTLASLYSEVVSYNNSSVTYTHLGQANSISCSNPNINCNSQGRNADSLSHYFGEDPARCPFEQGTCTNLFF